MNRLGIASKISKALQDKEIEHAYLVENGKGLGHGGDLDIVVKSGSLRDIPVVLAEAGMDVLSARYHAPKSINYIVDSELGTIQLDVVEDVVVNNRIVISNSHLLKDIVTEPELKIPRVNAGLWLRYYLAKKVYKCAAGIPISSSSSSRIGAVIRSDAQQADRVFESISDPTLSKAINYWVQGKDSDAQEIINGSAGVQWDSLSEPRTSRVSTTLILENFRRLVVRSLRPTGLSVAILGPDGVGKSLSITRLLDNASDFSFAQPLRCHLFPKPVHSTNSVPVTEPHSQPQRRLSGSLLQMVYWLFKTWVLWVRFVVLARLKSRLVVFDRYPSDIFADPYRYRSKVPKKLRRLFVRSLPQPDVTFVLDASVDTIVARSCELEASAIIELRSSYLDLANFTNATVIDANQSIDEVSISIEKVIKSFLLQRSVSRNQALINIDQ